MTTFERARTEPTPGGFMTSVMPHHDLDDLDEDIVMLTQPVKQITLQEKHAMDEKAQKRRMRNLANSWQERLQLISVITTFFASTEAAMLVNTKPLTSSDLENNVLKASNACLLGALILHVYTAVLSFSGAFLLIRYKVKEATWEEMVAGGNKTVNSPLAGSVVKDIERGSTDLGRQQTVTNNDAQKSQINRRRPPPKRRRSYPVEPPIFLAGPDLEQIGRFGLKRPTDLLSRIHGLCLFLASGGFILAIAGVLCYAWAVQPRSVSIFASVCLGFSFLGLVVQAIRSFINAESPLNTSSEYSVC